MERRDFYVYVWENSEGQPFYVGKGRGRRCVSRRRNEWFNRVLAKEEVKLGRRLKPYILEHGLTNGEALALEIKTIKEFREKGYPLTNLTDGGEGIGGFKHRPETKEKLRLKRLGTTAPEETRAKMREAAKTKPPVGSSTRKKLSKLTRGENNPTAKITEDLVREIYDCIILGWTNAELKDFVFEKIGQRINVDLYRTGRRWSDVWGKHPISKLPHIKSPGMAWKKLGSRERTLQFLQEVEDGVKTDRELAQEYGFKDVNTVRSTRKRENMIRAWTIFELQRLSKAQQMDDNAGSE